MSGFRKVFTFARSGGNGGRVMSMLSRLIHPMEEEEFYSVYWEKKPFVIHRKKADFYQDLLTFNGMDELLRDRLPEEGNKFRLISGDENQEQNLEKGYSGRVNKAGTVNDKLCAYGLGASIILNSADVFSGGALGKFCRQLEEDLKCCKVFTNVYMTPANAQGLETHADFTDVFVLQLGGKKVWKIYSSIEESLNSEEHEHFISNPGEVTMEFVLEEGDVLYIPRGYVHSASTRSSSSLHATMGIIRFSWEDFLKRVKDLLSKRNSILATPVPLFPFIVDAPTDMHDSSLEETEKQYRSAVESLFDLSNLSQGLEDYLFWFKGSREPSLEGQKAVMDGLNRLSLDSDVCVRDGFQYNFSALDGEYVLWFHDKHIFLSAEEFEAFRYLVSSERCKVGEISRVLTAEKKLDLVKDLCKECILRHV
ncbi:MAG: hypothetical protein ACI9S8_001162 [Chlamydiales bacterium]|jgi:hypothetical protein